MIVSCPHCSARYLLPVTSLAPSGRKVQCANCAESWFQAPDPDELREETGGEPVEQSFAEMMKGHDYEDIPESLKTRPEELSGKGFSEGLKPGRKAGLLARAQGIAAGLLLFLLVLAGLLLFKDKIISTLPDLEKLYAYTGFDLHVPGEGLVFDRVRSTRAVREGKQTVMLEGNIINLTRENLVIPYIEAQLYERGGDVVDSWLIEPPVDSVAGEDVVAFAAHYVYPSQNGGALDLSLRFIHGRPVSKSALTGGDNNQAHAPDDQTHRISLEAESESGQPEFGPEDQAHGHRLEQNEVLPAQPGQTDDQADHATDPAQ